MVASGRVGRSARPPGGKPGRTSGDTVADDAANPLYAAMVRAGDLLMEEALRVELDYYNSQRPHSAMAYQPPLSRIEGNNLFHEGGQISVAFLIALADTSIGPFP